MNNDACRDHEWARVWLQSNDYRETRYCRKCLITDNRSKQPYIKRQENVKNNDA